jgi:hypothetical protein
MGQRANGECIGLFLRLSCSCGSNGFAFWVPTATGRNLRIRCSQRLPPLDAGKIGDRMKKLMAFKKSRARHPVLARRSFIEEKAEGIVARNPARDLEARMPLCLT